MQLLIDLILEVIWCPLSAQSTCDITISPKERRLRIKISQTLLHSQQSTWLSTCLHPRNLSYDKRVHLYQICAVMLVERCPISLARLGGQCMYNLCSTWCWTSMLWSIDSCQNSYQLTSVQLVKLMFFLVLSSLVIGFQLITSSGPIFFQEEFSLLLTFCQSLMRASLLVLAKSIYFHEK